MNNAHLIFTIGFCILFLFFVIETIINIKRTITFIKKWKEKEKKEKEAQDKCPYKIESDGSFAEVNE
jgi:hypothetical protein